MFKFVFLAVFTCLTAIAALAALPAKADVAQYPVAEFPGTYQTKEWYGNIIQLQAVACEQGPYCMQVVGVVQGDTFQVGQYFMTDLKLRNGHLRRGYMRIPNGPSLPGGVFRRTANQVEMKAFGASEMWDRIK